MTTEGQSAAAEPRLTAISSRWWERAAVRAQVRRSFNEASESHKAFFPSALLPYLSHPAVTELGQESHRRLAIRHLYRYLLFTTEVETNVVNVATLELANTSPSPATRLVALQIYVDEGFHSLMNLDFVEHLAVCSGVPSLSGDFSAVTGALAALRERDPELDATIALVLQVVVFETSVTSYLRDVPDDEETMTCVREIVGDHARDEARHHAFYSEVLKELAPDIPQQLARRYVGLMRESADIWLGPDRDGIVMALRAEGLSPVTAARVVNDTYRRQDANRGVDEATRHLRRLLKVGPLAPHLDVWDAARC